MAFLFKNFLLICYFFFSISPSISAKAPPFSPKALVLPVSKDKCTSQYTTQINQRTPLVPVKLTLDLGGPFIWMDCDGYVSSSYKPVSCNSPLCSLSNSQTCNNQCHSPPMPGCHNNTCQHLPFNGVVIIGTIGDIGQDIVSLQSFNGKNLDRIVSVPDFPFVCTATYLLENLADGVTGMAGLGRGNISLPAYFSSTFGFSKKFTMCLSSSTKSKSVIFFGDVSNYSIIPINLLTYTPLILNPVGLPVYTFFGEKSTDYYIGVKSIRVDGNEIKFDKKLLSIDKDGNGGTMLSTINPYTVLHTSIYIPLIQACIKKIQVMVPLVIPRSPVPFEVCFQSTGFEDNGDFEWRMPVIDLMLESDKGNIVNWRLGVNALVSVNSYIMCLAIVDGGSKTRTPIIIGGRQLEDNLVQFDLENSRLGFSSNLFASNTSCSNFGF